MKTAEQVKPNYGPVYAAAMYPDLARIFVDHGYALAAHGSLARDFDLIAIPWVDKPSTHDVVIDAILSKFAIEIIGEPTCKPHGRVSHSLSVGFGCCQVDLSFMPRKCFLPETIDTIGGNTIMQIVAAAIAGDTQRVRDYAEMTAKSLEDSGHLMIATQINMALGKDVAKVNWS